MGQFYVHDGAYVLRQGTCPDGMESLQALEGETAVAGAVPDLGAPPTQWHRISVTAMEWVDPRDLQQLKDAKWDEIKAAREAAEFGGFTWDGSAFDSDLTSQSRIQGAAQLATLSQLAGQPFSIDWTLADNTVRSLDATDMIAAGQAMGVHIASQHAIGRGKRAQIDAATTPAEVAAVVW